MIPKSYFSKAFDVEWNDNFGFWEYLSRVGSQDVWDTWERVQSNGVVSYVRDTEHNLGVGLNPTYIEFGKFCDYTGRILDVGVGPQRIPAHLEYVSTDGVEVIGVDPLIGEQPKGFEFVRAYAESLPFKRMMFDRVLFALSIDHFTDARKALIEARRVLKPGGQICVWIGEKSPDAPPPKQSFEWYDKLKVPDGAYDRFHIQRFNSDLFESIVRRVGLTIDEVIYKEVSTYRRNLFYRIVR